MNFSSFNKLNTSYKVFLIIVIVLFFSACDKSHKEWQSVKQLDSIHTYSAFIESYPESIYIDSAETFINLIHFKLAKDDNTILSYKEFLELVPEGNLADSANELIQIITDDRHPSFADVNCILFREKELNNQGNYSFTRMFSIMHKIFEVNDIYVTKDENEEYQAEFIAEARGNALGASYTAVQGKLSGFHYTGADVNFNIRLIKDGQNIISGKFKGHIPVTDFISHNFKKKKDAPWSRAVYDSEYPEFAAKLLYKICGKSGLVNVLSKTDLAVYVNNIKLTNAMFKILEEENITKEDIAFNCLKSYDKEYRIRGLKLFEDLKDTSYVTVFIDLLEDKDGSVRGKACDILNKYPDRYTSVMMLNLFTDPDENVRREAIYNVSKKNDNKSIPKIIEMLDDKHSSVCKAAEDALITMAGDLFQSDLLYESYGFDSKKRYWNKWWIDNRDILTGQ